MFPLYSVQAPEARATIFAVVGVGISIGLAVGSPVTAILWERLGLAAVCTVAILSLGLALYLVQRFLHEQPEEQAIMSK
jgi:predicted MFS family arabinose efflux permease